MALIEFIQIVLIICIISIIITGAFLFYRMIKIKLYNLFGLSLFFILYSIQFLGQFIFPNIIKAFYSQICLLFLILFIKEAFYKESRVFFPNFMIISFVILKAFDFYFRLSYNFQVPVLSTIVSEEIPIYYIFVTITVLEVSPPLIWLGYKAIRTNLNLKNYEIEPWVGKRYLLIASSALVLAISDIFTFFMPPGGGYEAVHPVLIIFTAFSFITFSFGNLIAWIMPKRLKSYFNKGYTIPSDGKLSENELLDNIRKQLEERGEK
ncbi:MAG: hypothetical protein ACFFBT_00105 [Promethearchaeota archaeon]